MTTPDGISLSSAGSKSKGKLVVDLDWAGGAFQKIDTVANSGGGTYTDNTTLKGGHILVYQVWSPAGDPASAAVCSSEVAETF